MAHVLCIESRAAAAANAVRGAATGVGGWARQGDVACGCHKPQPQETLVCNVRSLSLFAYRARVYLRRLVRVIEAGARHEHILRFIWFFQ